MSDSLSKHDKAILSVAGVTRGFRIETLKRYRQLAEAGTIEALRKRGERMCDAGWLVASKLPRGPQLYRPTHKSLALLGAPPAWASSPSPAVATEILATSALGWQTDRILLLSHPERDSLFRELTKSPELPKTIGRFLLRRMKVPPLDGGGPAFETHIHALVAELRPPEQLVARVGTIVKHLARAQLFSELIATRLFGITLVAPSSAVKKVLETNVFPVETVIEDIQDVIAS